MTEKPAVQYADPTSDTPEKSTLSAYAGRARQLAREYETQAEPPLKDVFERWLVKGGRILELGCGSGRDARWLAGRGMRVLATDGTPPMLRQAQALAQAWPTDSLTFSLLPLPVSAGDWPEAQSVLERHAPHPLPEAVLTGPFDAVLAVGVLQHLSDESLTRTACFLQAALSEAGALIVSVPTDHPGDGESEAPARTYFNRPACAYSLLLARFGLTEVWRDTQSDTGAAGRRCTWTTMVFLKDESRRRARTNLTGILENDRKTTTYKYALVRSLCDINIQSSALARYVGGPAEGFGVETIAIPLALIIEHVIEYYWQIYRPSLTGGAVPSQIQRGRNLGIEAKLKDLMRDFCGDWHAFREKFYQGDFGRASGGDRCRHLSALFAAVADALVDGPIKYAGNSLGDTAAAGTHNRLFTVRRGKGGRGPLTPRALAQRYGELLMPADIWKELNFSAPSMVDSVLLHWARYSAHAPSNAAGLDLGEIIGIMLPADAQRNVGLAKSIYGHYLNEKGASCVWTGRSLRAGSMHIDHMLPWSRLHNNDLWNLVPASKSANLEKSDRIPSNELLYRSRHRIIDAWRYIERCRYGTLLRAQAENVLPCGSLPSAGWETRLFDAVLAEDDLLAHQFVVRRWNGVSAKAIPGAASGLAP